MGLMTRSEVVEIRNKVRALRCEGRGYDEIGRIMKFGSGGTEAAAYDMDIIKSDDSQELKALVENLAATNPPVLQDYLGGKKTAIGSLIGTIRKSTSSPLDAKAIREALIAKFG